MNALWLRTMWIACALLVVSGAAASTAAAYGFCGNGVLERDPNNVSIAGEQCDNGKDNGETGSGCTKGCWYLLSAPFNGLIEKYNNEYTRTRRAERGMITAERYGEKFKDYYLWEECDDNNNEGGDGCSKEGLFETATVYPPMSESDALCGNGVIDLLSQSPDRYEGCDGGPYVHNQGACTKDCKNATGKSEQNYLCVNTDLCGNAIIDKKAGEECDDGEQNGPNGRCSDYCTFNSPSTPAFVQENYVSFPTNALEGIFDGYTTLFHSRIWPLIDKETLKLPLNADALPAGAPPVEIRGRGQVISIPKAVGHQYSGIFYSGKEIRGGVDVTFRISPFDGGAVWDNDAFGLVFGADKNKIGKGDANYIMLSWRSGAQDGKNAGGFTKFTKGSRCEGIHEAGMRGVQVYHIKGVPDYGELWQMKDCGNSSSPRITHFATQSGKVPSTLTGTFTPDPANLWNRMQNPAYTWRTWYTWDLSLQGGSAQRGQIRARYSVKGLEVWVNHQKVIDIDGTKIQEWPVEGQWGFYFLGMDNLVADFRGFRNRIVPDNYEEVERPGSNPKGTQCGYCGDGIVQLRENGSSEACDDGNNDDGDGCNKNCEVESEWACYFPGKMLDGRAQQKNPYIRRTGKDGSYTYTPGRFATVCVTGSLDTPKDSATIAVRTPLFKGTYTLVGKEASPTHLSGTMTIKRGTATAKCPLSVNHSENTWAFDWKEVGQCSLGLDISNGMDTGDYTVSVELKYQRGGAEAIVDIIPIKVSVNTDYPDFNIKARVRKNGAESDIEEGPIVLGKRDRLELIFGDCRNIKTRGITAGFYDKSKNPVNGTLKSSIDCDGGHWMYDSPPSIKTKDGETDVYFVRVSAKNGSNDTVEKELKIIVDKANPNPPSLFDVYGKEINDNDSRVIPQLGGKAIIKGKISDLNPERDSAVEVKIELVEESSSKTIEKVVKVNDAGDFIVEFDLPEDYKGKTYIIRAIATDAAKNKSTPTQVNSVTFADVINHAGYITVIPSDGSILGPQDLKDGKVIIQGSSTPAKTFHFHQDTSGSYIKICTVNLFGGHCGSESKLYVERNKKTGEWKIRDGFVAQPDKDYRIIINYSYEGIEFKETSDFRYSDRDLSHSTQGDVEIVKPDKNEATINSQGNLEVTVATAGSHFKKGDTVVVTMENKEGCSEKEKQSASSEGRVISHCTPISQTCILEDTTISGKTFACSVAIPVVGPGRPYVTKSVKLTAKVKAPNGTESKPVTKEVALIPTAQVTKASPDGVEGTNTHPLPATATLKVYICTETLASSGVCDDGNRVAVKVDLDNGKWTISKEELDKVKLPNGTTLADKGTYVVQPAIVIDDGSSTTIELFTTPKLFKVENAPLPVPGDSKEPKVNCDEGTYSEDGNCTMYTDKKGEIRLSIDAGTKYGGKQITLVATDQNGKIKTISGQIDSNGLFEKTEPATSDRGEEMTGPYTITYTIDSSPQYKGGKPGATITMKARSSESPDDFSGIIAGGCSSTRTPANSILAVLFAVFGLAVLRRRRQ